MTTDSSVGTRANRNVDLEEAMVLAGHGKFHYLLLLGCAFIVSAFMLENFSPGFIIASAQCDFQMTPEQKGLLNSITSIGIISSSHFWGFIADTRGRKLTLIITLAMDFILAVASSFAPNYYIFLTIRFFNGFFICGPTTLIYTYMGEFHSSLTRSRAIIFLNVLAAISGLAIPVLGWLILPQHWTFKIGTIRYSSWRLFVTVCGIPSILGLFFLLLFLPETPKYFLAKGKSKEALNVLGSMYALNKWDSAENFQVTELKSEIVHDFLKKTAQYSSIRDLPMSVWYQTTPLFQKTFVLKTLLICLIQFILFGCFNSVSLWLPEIFNALAHFSVQNSEHSLTTCDIISLSYNTSQSTNSIERINNTLNTSVMYETATYSNQVLLPNNCVTDIVVSAFQNSFIIGASAGVESLIAGFLVNHIGNKKMLFGLLLTSGCCGIGLAFTKTTTEVLILALFYETFCGLSTVIVSSIAVDTYPTNLRAMAVCLSLMVGRIGIVVGSLFIGSLIALNCSLLFIIMGSIVIVGCILTQFLPA